VSRAAESAADDRRLNPIPISNLKRTTPVDFNKEILPLLKNNCLACHNKTTAKAGLVLETPADMLKGGDSGPAIQPKKGDASLLIKAAAHQLEDTVMPPPGNKVRASDFTSDELALIRLWVQQGAVASTTTRIEPEWRPLPANLNPIYAVALTSDGQFAACGRGNRIFIYHLPTSRIASELTDSSLSRSNANQSVAHRDLVESLAFSPDGSTLASGSYREIKLWQSPPRAPTHRIESASASAITVLAVSPDGKWFATGDVGGHVKLRSVPAGKAHKSFPRLNGAVNDLAFSPDSALLCSGSNDRSLHVWTVPAGKQFARIETPAEISSVLWLANSDRIASGGSDGLIQTWKLDPASQALKPVQELRGHQGPVTSLSLLASTNTQILSGGLDGTVRLWNAADGTQVREIKHGALVTSVATRPDGKRLASAGVDGITRLWNPDGSLVSELRGERRARDLIAELERTTNFLRSEVVFRLSAARSAETNEVAQTERVKKGTEADESTAKALAEKQKLLAEAKESNAADEKSSEDIKAQLKKANESLATTTAAAAQAVSQTGTKATNAIDTAEAKAKAEKLVGELKEKEKQAAEKVKAAAKKVTDTEADVKKATQARANAETELQLARKALGAAEGKTTAARMGVHGAERAEVDTIALLRAEQARAAQYNLPVRDVAFSPDNIAVVTTGDDRLVHTWSAENGMPFETFRGHVDSVRAAEFTRDGLLITAGDDRNVEFWRLGDPWTLARVVMPTNSESPPLDRVTVLKFSPAGDQLAAGGGVPTRGGEITLWSPTTGALIQSYPTVHSDVVFALDFLRDGRLLATGAADRFAKVIDLRSSKTLRQLEGHTHHVLGVGWKRDGRTLATAGADNLVKIWDFETGDRKKNVTGFDKEVTSISFVGYTDQAVTTSGDGKVRLIREDGNEVRSFPGATDFVYSAAATPDGKIVIAGGQDGVLRVWNGTDGQLITSFPPP
jgi:WD40 repeat protein